MAAETDALLQGMAQAASLPEAPAGEAVAVETAPVLQQETASNAEAEHLTAGITSPQVDGGISVTTAAESCVATDSETAQTAHLSEVTVDDTVEPSLVPPVATAEAEALVKTDQQAQQPVTDGTNISTSGLAGTHNTAGEDGLPAKAQTEPERGRSRKRRARWGPPANKVAEPATDTPDGEQTGRRKRRSRWEEPAPAEDSQQLAVVDMTNGSGFPHEIVLAGGIKVSLAPQPAYDVICKKHMAS